MAQSIAEFRTEVRNMKTEALQALVDQWLPGDTYFLNSAWREGRCDYIDTRVRVRSPGRLRAEAVVEELYRRRQAGAL